MEEFEINGIKFAPAWPFDNKELEVIIEYEEYSSLSGRYTTTKHVFWTKEDVIKAIERLKEFLAERDKAGPLV